MHTFHKGDTPTFQATLVQDDDNTPYDLTGATVTFSMFWNVAGKLSDVAKVNSQSTTISTPASGIVQYPVTATNSNTVGKYLAYYKATLSDGTILTFPQKGYISIEIIK